MEVVDKNGNIIHSDWVTVDWDKFINEVLPNFNHIRVVVGGGRGTFPYSYFAVSKEDVIQTVRMGQYKVTYSIMFNSKVNCKLEDVLFIKKMRMAAF